MNKLSMNENLNNDFLSVLEANIAPIVKIVNVYAHTMQDRKDLMNDIFYELWKSYPRFRGDSKISTWIYRVALNVSLSAKRKKENNRVIFVDELRTLDGENIFEPSDDKTSEINKLYECIELLDPVNKAIILLYLDEKTNDEIATITGMSKTNISTRLNRIREQLRTKLRNE